MKQKFKNINTYLDTILGAEPTFSLSEDFSKKIEKKIVKIVSWEVYWKQFIRFIAGAILTILMVVGVFYFVSQKQLVAVYNLISKHYLYVLFVVLIAVIIAFYDIVLLNYMFYKYNKNKEK